MKIALDLEGVLADTKHVVVHSDDNPLTLKNYYKWGFSQEDYEIFRRESHNAWVHRWKDIPTVEPNLSLFVSKLNELGTVDILTRRTGVDEEVRNWLDLHNIEYNEFIPTDTNKSEFDYDEFIDDNPMMIGEVGSQLLRDRLWNRSVDTVSEVNDSHGDTRDEPRTFDDVTTYDWRYDNGIVPEANPLVVRIYSIEDAYDYLNEYKT